MDINKKGAGMKYKIKFIWNSPCTPEAENEKSMECDREPSQEDALKFLYDDHYEKRYYHVKEIISIEKVD